MSIETLSNTSWRDELERAGDFLETIARTKLQWREQDGDPVERAIAGELFARAWELKQYARAGSPSEGI